jgi:hypothetical protein
MKPAALPAFLRRVIANELHLRFEELMMRKPRIILIIAGICLAAAVLPEARAASGFLAGLKKHQLLTSTQPENGDQNPYALVVAPVSAGTLQKGDVLVDNFNNSGNLQGTGSTIIDYRPSTGQMSVFATVPHDLAGCPGGIGLSTAMTMLKTGWVIVGSAPSTDGTTKTLGAGCLIVLNAAGKVAETISGPKIADPWGNMAVIDSGGSATLFVSNAGFGIGAPGQAVQHKATVLRIALQISPGKPPVLAGETVVANGLGAQADAGAFLIGPTGLAPGAHGGLFVSDAIGNRIVSIQDAVTRTDSAGTGKPITAGGMLNRPLAMTLAPNGDLLAVNGLDGNVVEVAPDGAQVAETIIDGDAAQSPPGSGDLFGIAINPGGKGFYYVEDDVNTLVQAQ